MVRNEESIINTSGSSPRSLSVRLLRPKLRRGGNGEGPKTIVGTWSHTETIGPDTFVRTLVNDDVGGFTFTATINGVLNVSYSGTYTTSGEYWIGNFDTTVPSGDFYMYIKDIDSTHKGFIYSDVEEAPDSDDLDENTFLWDGENSLIYEEPNLVQTYEIATLASPSTFRQTWAEIYKDGSDNDLFRYEKNWTATATPLSNVTYEIGKFYDAVLEKAQITSKYALNGDSLVFHWYGIELTLARQ